MRVLFFVEPFPIRNTETHFGGIARTALALAGGNLNVDVRVYANSATLKKLGEIPEDKERYIVRPTPEEDALFASHLMPWADQGIAAWTQLITGGEISSSYADVIRRIWHCFPFDLIINWGENQAVFNVASEVGARHIAMELGCTRPPFLASVAFDPFGVNGNSLPARMNLDMLRAATAGRMMPAHVAQALYSETGEARPIEYQFAPMGDRVRAALLNSGKKVAFLPLQLYDDANLLVHSKYSSLAEVVEDVVPRLSSAGYYVIIKPHPSSKHRPNALVENQLARLSIKEFENDFFWCDENLDAAQNCAILQGSDLVVTVNSSVGFEALYYDKRVVVLGSSSYKIRGVFPELDEVLLPSFDYESYLKNIGLLRAFMLEGYLASTHAWNNLTAFLQRVQAVAHAADVAQGDPGTFAKLIYETFAPTRRYQRTFESLSDAIRPTAKQFLPPAPGGAEVVELSWAGEVPGVSADDRRYLQRKVQQLSQAAGVNPELWLEEAWTDKNLKRRRLTDLGCLDRDYIADRYDDGMGPRTNPIAFFIDHGDERALSPSPKLSVDEYLESKGAAASRETPLKDMLLELLAAGRPKVEPFSPDEVQAVERARAELTSRLGHSTRRLAVVAHLYYADLVEELLDTLDRIPEPFDLIVTLPSWGDRPIRELVRARHPSAVMVSLPNRGRDIGSFLEVLPFLIQKNYLAVLKLQTKRGFYRAGRLIPSWGEAWRKLAFRSLLYDENSTRKIVSEFERNGSVNMIGPERLYVPLAQYPSANRNQMVWKELGLPPMSQGDAFFAGTMFWVRPSALKPLIRAGVNSSLLGVETGTNDGALAHDFERYLCALATRRGGSVMMTDVDGGTWTIKAGRPHMRGLNIVIEECLVKQHDYAHEKESLSW